MKLLLVGQPEHLKAAYTPLLRAGQRVLASASSLAALQAQLKMEQPEGILVLGEVGADEAENAEAVAEALAAILHAAQIPAVLLRPPQWPPEIFVGVAVLVDEHSSLPAAIAALKKFTPARSIVPKPKPSSPARPAASAPAASPSPAPASTASPPAASPSSIPIGSAMISTERAMAILHPALGGVGSSTLALTLAAIGAAAGINSLTVTSDVFPLVARLGFPPAERGVIRSIASLFSAVVTEGDFDVPREYDLVLWDMWQGTEDLVRTAPVAIVTRPTGEGLLAAVQAIFEVQSLGGAVAGLIIVGRGSLNAAECVRLCQDHGIDAVATWHLPDDPLVIALNETEGQALEAPRYGPAVHALARELFPGLPWPVEEPEKQDTEPEPAGAVTTHKPRRSRKPLFEFVD